jgi:hypothetical protein
LSEANGIGKSERSGVHALSMRVSARAGKRGRMT